MNKLKNVMSIVLKNVSSMKNFTDVEKNKQGMNDIIFYLQIFYFLNL